MAELPEAQMLPVGKLQFDARNPRLQQSENHHTQDGLLKILWDEFSVDEVALSIAANGYFRHEPLFAAPDGEQFVVIEGNRRLAAVVLLRSSQKRNRLGATDLPTITKKRRSELSQLPVIICEREQIWQYLGFKHVNGPQAWQSFAKAEYIAWVRSTIGASLGEIADQIGDQHSTVRRLYRAYSALEQAEKAGVFDRNDRTRVHFSFSHLYTGLDYAGFERFTGVVGEKSYRSRPIPKGKLAQFGEVCEWLYGSKAKDKAPLIRSQNPDLRVLDEVLRSKDGVAALRRGLPLRVSRDIAKGDEVLFRESLVGAKRALEEARGKIITGYKQEPDLLQTARDIVELADSNLSDMERMRTRERARRRSRSVRRTTE